MSKRKQVEVSTDDLLKQQIYINEIRQESDEYYASTGRKKTYHIVTYGCQMNEHDSEKLAGMLDKMGYEETNCLEKTDLVIYNTCCVRENAELKVYGNLGQLKPLKKENPDMVIAVCGCMMQQAHVVEEIKRKYSHVDLVFGTHNLHNFPQLLANCKQSDSMLVEIWDEEGKVVEGIPVIRKFGLKSFVNIMYGCNNFCTYCIVPYTRGRERSRKPEDIIREIKELVATGTKEVTLLGQNVNSYGKTLDEVIEFADLLYKINEIDGLKRIRFMTSHPKDLSPRLIEAMRDCENICEHIHLPVQAGSSRILKKMNRHYTKEQYLDLVYKLKSEIPGITITTDFIVGFPGETEEDFLETLDLVKKVEYDAAFTFLYSIREGTPAAKYEDQIPEEVKHARFNRLLEVLNAIVGRKNAQLKDTIVEVLVEGESKTDSSKLMGRTRTNKLVNFSGPKDTIGQLVQVRITEPKTFSLNGIYIKP
ncbi:tRNA (N6-isopentenyl adenosine(37)-C2)-methylthiotransferase MiaB [Thermotalea metallivorans]|uniref:tRNA-2-methylthio-N(6)-dimethylallyladenosine synthase n=1 Tax=Thermotalea metallivorans TaxID=520762 RepID=A0A140L8I7_9FIRM|nr:tRNA (N6-isopentenyl adenosine(37)-C2)-methylthiotransferase MiaB [Thermotalea metallivorans]KXG76862.1 tRNA-2-methylthio-N(6)-dimethylallyladenosine synthase [Thermotalea metallivorans]